MRAGCEAWKGAGSTGQEVGARLPTGKGGGQQPCRRPSPGMNLLGVSVQNPWTRPRLSSQGAIPPPPWGKAGGPFLKCQGHGGTTLKTED